MSLILDEPKAPKDLGFFRRKLNSLNTGLVGSTCRKCCSFVGASARPELLDCVERLHHCVSRGAKVPLPRVAPA